MPDDLPPIPLVRMKADVFGIIGAILRGGKVIIPRGSDAVQGRDRVLVFCRHDEEEAVRDFFLNRVQGLAG
jgi:Trk K+ transport system NAD-binding subunit